MKPRTIFHITTQPAWDEAQEAGSYSDDSLLREGFIHCSTAEQLPHTAERVFPGRQDLIALAIDPSMLRAEVRYEKSEEGEEFPHIYGAIPVAAVTRVMKLATGEATFTHGV